MRLAYILTQTPLPATVTDIWRLAYDHASRTIVMLNQLSREDEVRFQTRLSCKLNYNGFVQVQQLAHHIPPAISSLNLCPAAIFVAQSNSYWPVRRRPARFFWLVRKGGSRFWCLTFQDCPVYWPTDKETPIELGPLRVTLLEEQTDIDAAITIRDFSVILKSKVICAWLPIQLPALVVVPFNRKSLAQVSHVWAFEKKL